MATLWKNDKGELHREDGPAVEWSDGSKEWFINNKLHREDGPAYEGTNGSKYWYLNGKLHRLEGPAIEDTNGDKSWYLDGKLHREDGPAIEWADGTKEWYLNGELHRIDGPAIEYPNGDKEWFFDNKEYSEEEFNKKVIKMNKDKPTEINFYGDKYWKNEKGLFHREDGPAIEYASGTKVWYINGKRHREDGPAMEWAFGSKEWWINNKRHREDGPACEGYTGSKYWYINGKEYSEEEFNKKVAEMNKSEDKDEPTEIDSYGTKIWKNDKDQYHRLDGPAIECSDGTKAWYINNKLHREDGPAIEWSSGKLWYINGKLHRKDGPAIEGSNGHKEWYIDGQEYSEEEFNKFCKISNNNDKEAAMGIIDRISESETVGIVKDSATTAVKLTLARQTSRFLADITRKILATGMEKSGYGDKTGILYTPIGDFIVELTIPMVVHSIAANEKLPKFNSEIETVSEWAIRANLSLYTMRFADQGADLIKASISDKNIRAKIKELVGLGSAIKKAESGDSQALKDIAKSKTDVGLGNLEEEDEENLGLHEIPGIALD